jgi:hypothetical protein
MANNIMTVQSITRQKLKESLKPTKDVSLEIAKKVITHQVKLIKEKSDFIKDILNPLPKTM